MSDHEPRPDGTLDNGVHRCVHCRRLIVLYNFKWVHVRGG